MRIIAALLFLFAASAVAGQELYRWKDDHGVVHYSDTPPSGRSYETRQVLADPPRPAADPTPPAAAPTAALSRCEQAQQNLKVFEAGGAVAIDLDGDGTPEPLDAPAREREFNRARELVRVECDEAAGR
jgi:hypothetical protein